MTGKPTDWDQLFLPALTRVGTAGELLPEPADTAVLSGARALFVFDLEMSGPNPRVHEILDIGGVLAALEVGLPERSSFGTRVRPRRIGTAEPGALKVVGYTAAAWRGAADLAGAARSFLDLGHGAVPAGWGIGQDMAFLAELLREMGEPWPFAPVVLDIQGLARQLLGGGGTVDRFNLGHVADRLGIGRMGEHGALADAYATYDVLVKLLGGGVTGESRSGSAGA